MSEVGSIEGQYVARRADLIKKALYDNRANEKIFSTTHRSDPDQVFPGIFIGDESNARDRQLLRQFGITHVVNAATGKGFGMVNTSASYYADLRIKFLGIELSDLSVSDASQFFHCTADFIDEALREGGKVLVHCLMGISRSSTLVLAFLMIKRNMSAVDAVTEVRTHRNVHPNEGFITQLAALDLSLEKTRANSQQ